MTANFLGRPEGIQGGSHFSFGLGMIRMVLGEHGCEIVAAGNVTVFVHPFHDLGKRDKRDNNGGPVIRVETHLTNRYREKRALNHFLRTGLSEESER